MHQPVDGLTYAGTMAGVDLWLDPSMGPSDPPRLLDMSALRAAATNPVVVLAWLDPRYHLGRVPRVMDPTPEHRRAQVVADMHIGADHRGPNGETIATSSRPTPRTVRKLGEKFEAFAATVPTPPHGLLAVSGDGPWAQDEDDAPISLVPTEFAGRAFARDVAVAAPEVAGTARHLLDPAKAAAVEWRELDRHLVQLTVEQRREVLTVVRRMRGVE